MAAWNSTRDLIQPQLRILRNIHPEHRFVLVGHSLGGAVAGLAGLEMRNTGEWGDVEVVTFGEPMWGNRGTAAFVNRAFGCGDWEVNPESCQYRRVVNRGDPVPDLPPADWGWTAHGGEIMILRGGLNPQREDISFCQGDDILGIGAKSLDVVGVARPFTSRLLNPAQFQPDRGLYAQKLFRSGSGASWPLDFPHREYFVGMGICFDMDWN